MFMSFMEEIKGVFMKAEKEDSLADSNAWVFKQMEKEGQRFHEQESQGQEAEVRTVEADECRC